MREKDLIDKGSPCSTDFYDTSIQTVQDAKSKGPIICPNFAKCKSGALGPGSLQCVMLSALAVAQYTLKEKTLIDAQIQEFHDSAELKPPDVKGYMDTNQNAFQILTNWNQICEQVKHYAGVILDLKPEDYVLLGSAWMESRHLAYDYPVLRESKKDKNGKWAHKCGTILHGARIIHPIHDGPFPLSGSGQCWTEIVPFCPHCQKKPSESGTPTKSNPYEDREMDVLHSVRKK